MTDVQDVSLRSPDGTTTGRRLSVLHVIVRVGPTNSQYNEHCLPMRSARRITVCSLFPVAAGVPRDIRIFAGDGTLRGSWRALRRAVSAEEYDVVHAHAPSSAAMTLALFLLTGRPRRNLVFTLHNSFGNFRLRSRILLRVILALYPTVVLCGAAVRDTLPPLLRRLTRRKIHVVPNGVDVDRIDRVRASLPPERPGPRRFTVVSVNRLIPIKDPFTTLNAYARTHDGESDLRLVGAGPLGEELSEQIDKRGLGDHVRLTGLVPRDDVFRTLARADVLVSTSRGEGLPVGVLEALACGCPVILSDIPPHREIADVVPGVPLVPVGDVRGFAAALRAFRTMEPALRRELVPEQRSSVSERFSVQSMNRAYGEVYMDIVQSNGKRGRRGPGSVPDGAQLDSPERNDRAPRGRLALVVALTLAGALAGLGYAQVRAQEFQATTSILVGNVIGGPADQEALDASASLAATYADLARREPVLRPVAEQGFARSWLALRQRVQSEVADTNPQLVMVYAVAPTRARARQLAAAVAGSIATMAEEGEVEPGDEFSREQLQLVSREIVNTQRRILATNRELEATTDIVLTGQLTNELLGLRRTMRSLETSYRLMVDIAPSPAKAGAKVEVLEPAYVSRFSFRPDTAGLVGAGAAAGLSLAMGWVYLGAVRRNRRAASGGPGEHARAHPWETQSAALPWVPAEEPPGQVVHDHNGRPAR